MALQSAQAGEIVLIAMENSYSSILETLLSVVITDIHELVEETKCGGAKQSLAEYHYLREVERILTGTVNLLLTAESKYKK